MNKVFEVPVKSEHGIQKSSIKCQKDIAIGITDEFTKHERIKTFTYLQ